MWNRETAPSLFVSWAICTPKDMHTYNGSAVFRSLPDAECCVHSKIDAECRSPQGHSTFLSRKDRRFNCNKSRIAIRQRSAASSFYLAARIGVDLRGGNVPCRWSMLCQKMINLEYFADGASCGRYLWSDMVSCLRGRCHDCRCSSLGVLEAQDCGVSDAGLVALRRRCISI